MLTKEKVAGAVVLPSGLAIFLWPALAYYAVAGFYLLTVGMLLADRPQGELFPPPDVEEDGGGLYWRLQPRWVKAIVAWVGVPVWLLFISEMSGPLEDANPIWFGALFPLAMLELVFIARAYWRMDI